MLTLEKKKCISFFQIFPMRIHHLNGHLNNKMLQRPMYDRDIR